MPEPAPARTSSGPSPCSTASRWGGLRPGEQPLDPVGAGLGRARRRAPVLGLPAESRTQLCKRHPPSIARRARRARAVGRLGAELPRRSLRRVLRSSSSCRSRITSSISACGSFFDPFDDAARLFRSSSSPDFFELGFERLRHRALVELGEAGDFVELPLPSSLTRATSSVWPSKAAAGERRLRGRLSSRRLRLRSLRPIRPCFPVFLASSSQVLIAPCRFRRCSVRRSSRSRSLVQLAGSPLVAEVSIASSISDSSLLPPPPQATRASAETISRQGRSR